MSITTSASTLPLEVTREHMLLVKQHGFIPASSLHEGLTLIDGTTGEEVTVESIQGKTARGMFAPFTASGKIVVNNVLASSYIVLEESPELNFLGVFGISFQWVAHSSTFPYRVSCLYLRQGGCADEAYTSEGLNEWTAASLNAALWLLELQNTFLKGLLSIFLLTTVLIFYLLDLCLHTPASTIIFALIFAMPSIPWRISIQRCAQLKHRIFRAK